MFRKSQVERLARAEDDWQKARNGREISACKNDPAVKRAAAVRAAAARISSREELKAWAELEMDRTLGPDWRNS